MGWPRCSKRLGQKREALKSPLREREVRIKRAENSRWARLGVCSLFPPPL
jgi:hypothetical protein